jgi:ubiquitin-protein ligase/uncharacterized protein YegL
VHRPSQLTSALNPCLTFDRNAHVAVYLGEEACSAPGQSSLVFRPLTGATETPDVGVVEQLIEPIIQTYESEGTAVFDKYGGADLRKLEAPDEILMFCVDCSASMRSATDFVEVNEGSLDEESHVFDDPASPPVEGEYFANARYEDVKEELCKHESFDDMVAIIANAPLHRRKHAASSVLKILGNLLALPLSQLLQTIADIQKTFHHGSAALLDQHGQELKRQKSFYAGLRTHEQQIKDFLIYRATVFTPSPFRWTWSLGDDVPTPSTSQHNIPLLADELTGIPDELRCPISQDIMVDAVKAGDGHVYSRHALQQWFAIRKSSPLHGTTLSDTSMAEQGDIINSAMQWIAGEDLVVRRSTSSITIKFNSKFGGFSRTLPPTLNLEDLYKLVFRGLKARPCTFQLVRSKGLRVIVPSSIRTIDQEALQDGEDITVRIAEEMDNQGGVPSRGSVAAGDLALIKVYGPGEPNQMTVAYWVNRYCSQSIASIHWKYWRAMSERSSSWTVRSLQAWMRLEDDGDGYFSGYPNHDPSKRLNAYLNRTYCLGQLEQESLHSDSQTASVNQTLVLKVQLQKQKPTRPRQDSNHITLSRLDVLKQMFEALINKILAFNYKTHVGLVTFSSKASVAMPISHVIENFRRATNKMEAKGDTALFDALALAEDQVMEYGARYPNAKRRVICISDGVDTKSMLNSAEGVAFRMLNKDVALDSICLGPATNNQLLAISDTLGCYKLVPFSLANAMAMSEMAVVLSLVDRPDFETPAKKSWTRPTFMANFHNRVQTVSSTVVNEHTFPEHKTHPNLGDTFIPLADAARLPGNRNTTTANGARSNLKISRLLNEMKQIVAGGPRATYDVYVSENDMAFWLAIMQGPSGTPYEGGTFMLYMHAEDRYPLFAPKACFVTRIKHPNVSLEGRICHSIFSRDYTTDTSMTRLLDTVYGMLLQVETSDPVNTTITLGYHHDQVEFNEQVREFTSRYAGKTRGEWKSTLFEGKDWNEGEEVE